MSTATKSPTSAARAASVDAHHAAGRARREQRDRAARDVVGGHDTAGRLHDEQRSVVPGATQLVLQVLRVVRDARRDVRVHQRGRYPFELGTARHHLVRERDVLDVGELLEHDLARAALVRGVHEREQVHDGDRARRRASSGVARRGAPRLVEREQRPCLRNPCVPGSGCAPGGARSGSARVVRIPDLFLVAAPQLDLVAVPFGDEQTRRRAVHLDHRVVGGGGAVHEDLEVAGTNR